MEVFLLRHGHAVASAPSDAERPLSERGRAEVRSTLKAAAENIVGLNAVWVSPYLRAQQTWQEARAFLPDAPKPITHPAITPSGNVQEVMSLIEQAAHQRLLLVTHQPFVGDLLDTLTGHHNLHIMGTANLAALSTADDMPVVADLAELLWLQRPQ